MGKGGVAYEFGSMILIWMTACPILNLLLKGHMPYVPENSYWPWLLPHESIGCYIVK